jgi:hypothetical protein
VPILHLVARHAATQREELGQLEGRVLGQAMPDNEGALIVALPDNLGFKLEQPLGLLSSACR